MENLFKKHPISEYDFKGNDFCSLDTHFCLSEIRYEREKIIIKLKRKWMEIKCIWIQIVFEWSCFVKWIHSLFAQVSGLWTSSSALWSTWLIIWSKIWSSKLSMSPSRSSLVRSSVKSPSPLDIEKLVRSEVQQSFEHFCKFPNPACFFLIYMVLFKNWFWLRGWSKNRRVFLLENWTWMDKEVREGWCCLERL